MNQISNQITLSAMDNGIYFNLSYSTPEIETNKAIANEFLAIKTGNVGCQYLYSVYNATINQKISQVFISGNYLVKVSDGVVTELYESEYDLNGSVYDYVAFGTGDTPIEYYVYNLNSTFTKYSIDETQAPVLSTISGFDDIPSDKQALLNDFSSTNRIFVWSDKLYGFCVEYVEIS